MSRVAATIDHSLVHPALTPTEIEAALRRVVHYPLATVCVQGCSVALVADALADTGIATCATVAFPHGRSTPTTKAFEAARAIRDGAAEIEMVCNTGLVLDEDWRGVRKDIAAVINVCRNEDAVLKVIFETEFITSDGLKVELCRICTDLGVDFVRTSTGFGFVRGDDGTHTYIGTTEHDLALIRANCGASVQVKASGAIRTLERAVEMLELGATRIGTRATVDICEAARHRFGC